MLRTGLRTGTEASETHPVLSLLSLVLNQRRLSCHQQITGCPLRECFGSLVGGKPLTLPLLPVGQKGYLLLQASVQEVVTLQSCPSLRASSPLADDPDLIAVKHQPLSVKARHQR